ncbi:HPr(Ser) kinase/phosphatase [bacterium]|nr:HPr(Ser) kinase/phosphatase [bacterium]
MDYLYKINNNNGITIKQFVSDLEGYETLEDLTKTSGTGKRRIRYPEFGSLGLLFLKFFKNHVSGQIYLLENRKNSYFYSLSFEEKKRFLESIKHLNVPLFVICGHKPLKRDVSLFREYNFPLYYTRDKRKDARDKIERYLNFIFAKKISIHGVLMDVFGIGILIRGKSGIGKSELAIDLLEKRHRLVADDLVIVHRNGEFITGYGLNNSPFAFHIEARGVGLINIKNLFGVEAIRVKKRVEIIIDLVSGDKIDNANFDRIRVKPQFENLLDLEIPKYTIPVTYSKNLANLIEVVALTHIATIMGQGAVDAINENINKSQKKQVIDKYFFIADDE